MVVIAWTRPADASSSGSPLTNDRSIFRRAGAVSRRAANEEYPGLPGDDAIVREPDDGLVGNLDVVRGERSPKRDPSLQALTGVIAKWLAEHREPVAALSLRLLEGGVRRAHQVLGACPRRPVGQPGGGREGHGARRRPWRRARLRHRRGRLDDGHADAEGDVDLLVAGRGRGAEGGDDPVGDLGGLRRVGDVLEQDDDLVAAQARDRVRPADRPLDPSRDRHEELVAGVVAQAVVDRLETVDVAEQDRGQGGGAPVDAVDGGREPVLQDRPVDQPGQGVTQGRAGRIALPLCDQGPEQDGGQCDRHQAELQSQWVVADPSPDQRDSGHVQHQDHHDRPRGTAADGDPDHRDVDEVGEVQASAEPTSVGQGDGRQQDSQLPGGLDRRGVRAGG